MFSTTFCSRACCGEPEVAKAPPSMITSFCMSCIISGQRDGPSARLPLAHPQYGGAACARGAVRRKSSSTTSLGREPCYTTEQVQRNIDRARDYRNVRREKDLLQQDATGSEIRVAYTPGASRVLVRMQVTPGLTKFADLKQHTSNRPKSNSRRSSRPPGAYNYRLR
jgi:hypothetical protein